MRNAFLVAATLIALSGSVSAQTRNRLLGTWKLVSASSSTATGARNNAPYGPNPTGVLIYTSEGRMAVMISYGSRKPLSVADRVAAPTAERAEAFATFLAYSGRYTVTGDKVVHHVELASIQNWVNTDQIRVVKYQGDRITLITPPIALNGRTEIFELVWERVRR
jgi:hypothetical protein